MKNYFINPETGRLRAGWRILALLILLAAVVSILMVGTRTILGSLKRGSSLQWSLVAIGTTLSVFIARKYLDKKSFVSLGLKWDKFAVLDILSGIVNSALLMAGVYFVMLWTNLIEFTGYTFWQDPEALESAVQTSAWVIAGGVFFQLTIVAWWEELVFRGYLVQNLVEGTSIKWTLILSSLIFGFLHYGNPNATIVTSLLIAVIAPQLIYAYLKTGQLWLPMGLHLGWNFFQASVFGFASSGQESPSLISQVPIGPDWLSGGVFGAEGSILIVPFTILSMVAIHYWVKMSRFPGQKAWEMAPGALAE